MTVQGIGSIEARLKARSRRHEITGDDLAAANRLLSLLVDCLNKQRDAGLTAQAERFAVAALADFLRGAP